MNKIVLAVLGFLGIGVVALVIVGIMAASFHNKEVRLRNLIVNKQTDNKNQMDKMWKNIAQVAEVSDEQKKALVEIFTSHAAARTSEGQGRMMAWIKESVPDASATSKTYLNLQNIIVSERDGFTMRQKEILDFKREHDNIIDVFPGNIFAMILGRQKINVVIVTSTRTEDAFKSGKDDDTQLFKRNNNVEKSK